MARNYLNDIVSVNGIIFDIDILLETIDEFCEKFTVRYADIEHQSEAMKLFDLGFIEHSLDLEKNDIYCIENISPLIKLKNYINRISKCKL